MGLLGFAPPQGLPSGGTGSGSGIAFQDEGSAVVTATTANFVGAGVAVTNVAGVATVTIPGGSGIDHSTTGYIFEDFIGGSAANGSVGEYGWTTSVANAGVVLKNLVTASDIQSGVITLRRGATSNGRAGIILGTVYDNGLGAFTVSFRVYIANLSDATDEYDFYVGMSGTAQSGFGTGIYLKYDRNTSTNWLRGSVDASVSTETDTTIAVTTGWNILTVSINSAFTQASYTINGSSGGSNTTNLPTAGNAIAPMAFIEGSAGSATREIHVDYCEFTHTLSSSR